MNYARVRRRLRWQILAMGVIGFLLPVLRAVLVGFPEPMVHDEFSYLLGADTFAHGRLTNPSPPLPEFFEAPHILVEPTYQSKYPPGGAVLMAAGQVLCGHPVWGVWCQSALFGAALCWMLQTFRLSRWAVPITLLALCALAPRTGVGHGYWPGMLAAASGAALFGGLNRTLRRPRVNTSAILALGVIGLAVTRPFEGALLSLGCIPLFLYWLCFDIRTSFAVKTQTVLLPGIALTGTAAALLGIYNQAVTGNWRTMPYVVHQQQYFHSGLFVFQKPKVPTRTPVPRIAATYQEFSTLRPAEIPMSTFMRGADRCRRTFSVALGMPESSYASWWVSPLVLIGAMHRPLRRYCLAAGLWLIGQTMASWCMPWYAMPIVPLFYAALAAALQRLTRRWRCPTILRRVVSVRTVLAGLLLIALLALVRHRDLRTIIQRVSSKIAPTTAEADDVDQPFSPATQPKLIAWLERQEGRHLVFVRYAPKYTCHDEWVYNRADIPGSKVILAHDLGDERNRQLRALFPDRRVWKMFVSQSERTLAPNEQ